MNVCAIGDCRETLARWAAEGVRVQMVMTSPPYWGLRNYQAPPLVWGGAAGCAHDWSQKFMRSMSSCLHCSAWRGSLGLEPTPELYVQHLVEVFRLVRDVLREDGTLWLNLGDSYCSQGGERPDGSHDGITGRANQPGPSISSPGLKPKNLVGIPWRVAFALQADGWYLRSDIIWSKPNPMPESVTDRPTKSHEYLFLLAKSERYYYNSAAIREPGQLRPSGQTQHKYVNDDPMHRTKAGLLKIRDTVYPFVNRRSVWTIATQPYSDAHFATFPEDLVKPCILAGSRPGDIVLDPFMGSGTVAKVAQDLGRQWLGCELSETYGSLIAQRVPQLGLVLR